MIAVAAGVKVLVATKPVDFRGRGWPCGSGP